MSEAGADISLIKKRHPALAEIYDSWQPSQVIFKRHRYVIHLTNRSKLDRHLALRHMFGYPRPMILAGLPEGSSFSSFDDYSLTSGDLECHGVMHVFFPCFFRSGK